MGIILGMGFGDHFGYGLSQWDTTLYCNVVSHWLSPYPEWSLLLIILRTGRENLTEPYILIVIIAMTIEEIGPLTAVLKCWPVVTQPLEAYDWGVFYQKQISRAEKNNYIPQYLWDVITCPCPWYLLLAHKSSYAPMDLVVVHSDICNRQISSVLDNNLEPVRCPAII